MEAYQSSADSLAVGLTKPATQFGVPLVAFYSNVMISFLLVMFFHSLTSVILFLALFAVLHVWMVWQTFRDPFGLQLAWLNFTLFKTQMNAKLWRYTDSFAP